MKKYIIAFVSFCILFFIALGFIYCKTSPALTLSENDLELEWHGRIENEFGTYNGTLIGDLFSGTGEFNFLSGETYTGDWQDSYMSGNGTVTFPGVGTYTGSMAESKRNGYGTFTWLSGDKYEGNWENDEMSGDGTYTFPDGGVFSGTFAANKAVYGKYTYDITLSKDAQESDISHIEYTLTSEYKNLKFETKGGLTYSGEASALFSEGEATITYPSGNTYKGKLSKGKRDGYGKFSWIDSNGKTTSYYEGMWKQDKMQGQGRYYYSSSAYPYLYGSFADNAPSGTLTYIKEANNTFETVWSKGTCKSIKET